MTEVNYLAVLGAALAAVVAAFVYYVAFGRALATLGSAAAASERPPPWLLPVELVKHLVVAAVVAGLVAAIGARPAWIGGVRLGLVLWVGFPVMILVSSVIHEKVPWKLASLHAGDWLLKLLIITVVVSVWR